MENTKIENVNVARFARNVKWDFFGDFQTMLGTIFFIQISNMIRAKSMVHEIKRMNVSQDILNEGKIINDMKLWKRQFYCYSSNSKVQMRILSRKVCSNYSSAARICRNVP